jgi:hypothetical protein
MFLKLLIRPSQFWGALAKLALRFGPRIIRGIVNRR